ncbi:type II secretion system F family protein [Candidatus Woesearchaeota archaeon]|nr:type II secretion system F family protein [Candidatus Woesearchaeota archaeon]
MKFDIKIRREFLIGIILFLLFVVFDFTLFFGTRWFWSLLLLSFAFGGLPAFLLHLKENKKQKEIEAQFLEFIRALVQGVKSGVAIPQSILNVINRDFGALNSYLKKLGYQIQWGIPVKDALKIFARETDNRVIRRSVAIIIQAEESGGKMDDILESVADNVVNIERLKEERKSSTYSQIVQGYAVFFIFIAIMLILEVKLMPMIQEMVGGLSGGASGAGFFDAGSSGAVSQLNFKRIFLSLIVIQGIFAGLLIGKFSEGDIKYGIKHSISLVVIALLLILTVAPP